MLSNLNKLVSFLKISSVVICILLTVVMIGFPSSPYSLIAVAKQKAEKVKSEEVFLPTANLAQALSVGVCSEEFLKSAYASNAAAQKVISGLKVFQANLKTSNFNSLAQQALQVSFNSFNTETACLLPISISGNYKISTDLSAQLFTASLGAESVLCLDSKSYLRTSQGGVKYYELNNIIASYSKYIKDKKVVAEFKAKLASLNAARKRISPTKKAALAKADKDIRKYKISIAYADLLAKNGTPLAAFFDAVCQQGPSQVPATAVPTNVPATAVPTVTPTKTPTIVPATFTPTATPTATATQAVSFAGPTFVSPAVTPGGPEITINDNQLSITWSRIEYAPGQASYLVRAFDVIDKTDPTTWIDISGNVSSAPYANQSIVLTNLINGHHYRFWVHAQIAGNNPNPDNPGPLTDASFLDFTFVSTATPTATPTQSAAFAGPTIISPTVAPGGAEITIYDNQLSITWSKIEYTPGQASYLVRAVDVIDKNDDTTWINIIGAVSSAPYDNESIVLANLINGHHYRFWVHAKIAGNNPNPGNPGPLTDASFLDFTYVSTIAPTLTPTVIVTPVPGAPIKIMALGDSITYGSASNDILKVNENIPGGYRRELGSKLGKSGLAYDFVGNSTENGSLGLDPDHNGNRGFKTDQILANLSAFLSVNPDIVLMHAGTNDLLTDVAVNTVTSNLSSLIDQITGGAPTRRLYVSTIIPILFNGSSDTHTPPQWAAIVDDYNTKVKALVQQFATEGRKVYLVDINASFKPDPNIFFQAGEGVHPNQAGYDIMGKLWFDKLKATETFPPDDTGTNLLTNGGFESDFSSWTVGKPTSLFSINGDFSSEGNNFAGFNSVNTATGGNLSHLFSTSAGASYTLTFDVAALNYSTSPQTIGLNVSDASGASSVLSDVFTISGEANPTAPGVHWIRKKYTFTANIDTNTLGFLDLSASTNYGDLLLDNVRVTLN